MDRGTFRGNRSSSPVRKGRSLLPLPPQNFAQARPPCASSTGSGSTTTAHAFRSAFPTCSRTKKALDQDRSDRFPGESPPGLYYPIEKIAAAVVPIRSAPPSPRQDSNLPSPQKQDRESPLAPLSPRAPPLASCTAQSDRAGRASSNCL